MRRARWNAMNPRIQRVQTLWNPGFTASGRTPADVRRTSTRHCPGNWVTIYRDRSNGREDIAMAATDGGAGMPQDQKTPDDQHAAVVPGDGGTRASDRERDAVVQRVQDAFAEGRLDDAEFDERSRAGGRGAPAPPPALAG